MSERSERKQHFYAVRHVLRTAWNPVGVDGLPEDEYDSYVWPIVGLLRDGADAETLAQHLRETEQFYFSRDTAAKKLLPVASLLVALGIEKDFS